MKFNPITIIIVGIFLYPILKGLIFGFSSYSLKRDVEGIIESISFIFSMYLGIKYFKNVFLGYGQNIYNNISSYLPQNLVDYFQSKPIVVYLILIPIFIYIVYKLISSILVAICKLTIYHLIDAIDEAVKNRSALFRGIVGAAVQLPKSICFLLVTLLILNIGSMFSSNKDFNNYLLGSTTYKYLCKEFIIPITNSSVAKQLPEIIDNSVNVVVKQNSLDNLPVGNAATNTIVYYNGVTLDEGIKSNSDIDKFAKGLVGSDKNVISKAKKLYDWEGEHIAYDYSKADLVLNNNYNVKSGAIPTFESRKGICFDYACLYVAMCRADNIKVRIVTGEGFNGVSWVSHAWNMVYVPSENKWINVDTTFSKGGDYFNSRMFNLDHKDAKIIGEW